MPRVKLESFSEYEFETEISVRTTDLNYRGHLGNDRLISLVHEARVAFLGHHGFTEMDCGGASLIIADTVANYRGEAFAGDILRFEVAAGAPTDNGFRLFCRITRPSDGTDIALVENGMVCFDYETRKTTSLPQTLRNMCKEI